MRYYLTIDESNLYIEHFTYDESDQHITYNYKLDFEKFAKALDKEFTQYLLEQSNKGILPLKIDEYSHPLSEHVIKKHEEFSTIINKK